MAIDLFMKKSKKQECNGGKTPTKIWLKRMTPQEALELLNNIEFKHEYQGQDQYADMLMWCKDALKKQMPKKVEFVDNGEELLCPCCGLDLMGSLNDPDHDPYYCFECGQALDWNRCEECASDIETATNKAIYEFKEGLIDTISKQFKGNWEIPCSSRDKTIQDTISIVYNIIRNYRK